MTLSCMAFFTAQCFKICTPLIFHLRFMQGSVKMGFFGIFGGKWACVIMKKKNLQCTIVRKGLDLLKQNLKNTFLLCNSRRNRIIKTEFSLPSSSDNNILQYTVWLGEITRKTNIWKCIRVLYVRKLVKYGETRNVSK